MKHWRTQIPPRKKIIAFHLQTTNHNGSAIKDNMTEHKLSALTNWLEDNQEEVMKYIQANMNKPTSTRETERSNKQDDEEELTKNMLPDNK